MINKNVIGISCLLLVFLSQFQVRASQPYTPERGIAMDESWRWTEFKELDTLGVRTVEFSSDGMLWFGGIKGLVRYDGLTFEDWSQESNLCQAEIFNIYEDQYNQLFVVSKRGITVYSNKTWEDLVVFPSDSLVNWLGWIYCDFLEYLPGSIYISTPFGLFDISANNKRIIAPESVLELYTKIPSGFELIPLLVKPELPITGVVFDVAIDAGGNTWFSLFNGSFGCFELSTNWDKPNGIKYYSVNQAQDTRGAVSFDMLKTGDINIRLPKDQNYVYHYHSQSDSFIPLENHSRKMYHSMIEMEDGTRWYGSFGELSMKNGSGWHTFKQPDYNISQAKLSLKKNGSSEMWLLGELNNVVRFDYGTEKYKSYQNLNFYCEDSNGTQWFLSTDNMVVSYSSEFKNWTAYSQEDGMIDYPVSIYMDQFQNLWILGSHQGQAAVTFGKIHEFHLKIFDNVCWGFDPRAFLEAADGKVYLGAAANCEPDAWGVVVYDPAQGSAQTNNAWHHYPGEELSEIVYSIGQLANGDILTGYYKGLSVWDGSMAQSINEIFDTKNTVSESMCQGNSAEKEVWIGTRNNGLIRYVDENNWERFTKDNGLASNLINDLLLTQDSTIYVATDKGVSIYDGAYWKTIALPEEMRVFREAGSIKQSRDGAIWLNKSSRNWNRRQFRLLNEGAIAQETPLVTYSFLTDRQAPVTTINVFEEHVSSQGNTIISWGAVDPWNYTAKEDLEYSFKLDDEEWTEYSKETSHLFLGLKPGKHTFTVRARDNDMLVDAHAPAVSFRVRVPLWRHPLIVLLSLAVIIVIYLQTRKVLQRNIAIQKQNAAMEKRNEELRLQQEHLKASNDKITKLMEVEKQNSWMNEGILKMDNILRTNQHDLQAVARQLVMALRDYLQITQITIYVKTDEDSDKLVLISSFVPGMNDQKWIYIGEGLNGGVFKDKKRLLVKDVPETYTVSSGLGECTIRELLIEPLIFDENCIGVMEVGTYTNFSESKLIFIERIAPNIAGSFNNILTNQKIEGMLKHSKKQAEILSQSEEELKINLEELAATQEEMRRKEETMIARIQELENLQN